MCICTWGTIWVGRQVNHFKTQAAGCIKFDHRLQLAHGPHFGHFKYFKKDQTVLGFFSKHSFILVGIHNLSIEMFINRENNQNQM